MFTKINVCVDFLRKVTEEKVFVITSGTLGKDLVPQIHLMPQVDSIYIFCGNRDWHKPWAEQWSKIKDVSTEIQSVCEALQQSVKQCSQDSTPMSFVSSNAEGSASAANLNQLEPSYMYTQLFKKFLLEIKHDKNARENLVTFCREQENLSGELEVIDEFEREYCPDKAVWWYTRECFTYQMLNRALRLLESHIIVDMGFLIHDLHRQIEQLHREQVDRYGGQCFTVYRGQGLSTAHFDKLQNTQSGLLSFNSFVSTSKVEKVSLSFARGSSKKADTVGVLFVMTIDPALTSTPFAEIMEHSYFGEESEVLFSMHSVFRVVHVARLDKHSPLFEVGLTLTADDDPQLRQLTKTIDQEVEGSTGWKSIGHLLIKVGHLQKAEELYNRLLTREADEYDMIHYNHQLGRIKHAQGSYKDALCYYDKCFDMQQKLFPANHLELALSYNNTGMVYDDMGEYSKALSYYEKSLDIEKNSLPANHRSLAISYSNIGGVYDSIGEYPKALSHYEKSLDIWQQLLPANHPSLATLHNNIGTVYKRIGEYSKALSYHKKSLDIRQKSLPANHPELATSYNNIGLVHGSMGEYSQALPYCEKSLDILQQSLPTNHPSLALSYNNIGSLYDSMREYSQALSYYEKSLDIWQQSLQANHPSLATLHNNIGVVYCHMGEYSKALSSYEKTLDIQQKSLPANHPDLALSYNNIGMVYDSMGEGSKSLLLLQRALDIWELTLPHNHPNIQNVLESIEAVKKEL